MLRRLVIWIAAVALLAQQGVVCAQEAGKNIEVRVMAYQDIAHGQKTVFIPNPMPGAVVSLIAPADTLHVVSDDSGYSLFRKVKAQKFSVKVECLGYETCEKSFLADTLDRVHSCTFYMKEKKEELKAAVVKEEVPVFEFIGDTLKYNVASVQKVSEDDMLADVMKRLPGISVSNNLVKIMNENVAKIYIDGKLVFGDNVGNPLKYLAGSEIVSLRVYDQATVEERVGLAPKESTRERVIDVETKSKLTVALIAQARAGYGRNIETTGRGMDNRYLAGVSGSWFSEMTQISANAYLNNVGASNEYAAISDVSSVPSSYGRIGQADLQMVKKFSDAQLGDNLNASYSYGDRKTISENSTDRVYAPDENWTYRSYVNESLNESRVKSHDFKVAYMNFRPYVPTVDLTFSVSDTDGRSNSLMLNDVDGNKDGYSQSMIEDMRDYRYSARVGKTFKVGKVNLGVSANVNGGYSSGTTIQRDTTVETSSVTTFVSEPQGNNFAAEGGFHATFRLPKKISLQTAFKYNRNYSSVNKLRFADAVAEANLDKVTSDVHTYNYDTYNVALALARRQRKGLNINGSIGVQYDKQRRSEMMPQKGNTDAGYLSVIPGLQVSYMKDHKNISLILNAQPELPSFEQVRQDFDVTNPMFVSRGNPDLKKSTNYNASVMSSAFWKSGHSVNIMINGSYVDNRIVSRTRYLTETMTVGGYEMAPGTTFSTYDNVDGSVSASANISWSTRIRLLKLGLNVSAAYDFRRDPSYIEDQLNVAYRHMPSLMLNLSSDFSRKYRVQLNSTTSYSSVNNSRYQNVSYLDQRAVLRSQNAFTDWFFLNAEYAYSVRLPFQNAVNTIQDHVLNAIAGFKHRKTGLEINFSCYDLLNMTSSFQTSVVGNYTQTTFTPNLGRIWLVSIVWRFNSTQKGGSVSTPGFMHHHLGGPIIISRPLP